MGNRHSFPYQLATSACVTTADWEYEDPKHNAFIPVTSKFNLPGWDYQRDLAFKRTITVDAKRIRKECRLGHARLEIVFRWHCRKSRHRDVGRMHVVRADQSEATVEGLTTIDGRLLRGQIELHSEIVLGESVATDQADPRAAHLRGSRLWQDEKPTVVVLEGTGERFPTQAVKFSKLFGDRCPDATWHLEWNPHRLNEPFANEVMVYLNSEHPRIARGLKEQDPLIMTAIRHDVGRRLIVGALRDGDWPDSTDELEEGSVGHLVNLLIQQSFPGRRRREILDLLDTDAERFERILQHQLRLFGEE